MNSNVKITEYFEQLSESPNQYVYDLTNESKNYKLYSVITQGSAHFSVGYDIYFEPKSGNAPYNLVSVRKMESIKSLTQLKFDITQIFSNAILEDIKETDIKNIYVNDLQEMFETKMNYKYAQQIKDLYLKRIELEDKLSKETVPFTKGNEDFLLNANYFKDELVINIDKLNNIINLTETIN